MADIVIINPSFDTSFWGMERCVGLLSRSAQTCPWHVLLCSRRSCPTITA